MNAETPIRNKKRCWYFISYIECPVCGKEEEFRERRFGPRPEAYEDRHDFRQIIYDHCDL